MSAVSPDRRDLSAVSPVGKTLGRRTQCHHEYLTTWIVRAKCDYTEIAEPLQMRSNSVAVSVHRLKVRFRELVCAQVADTVSDPK
jgi:hypothetical protein